MKMPKTAKGYLEMLIRIAEDGHADKLKASDSETADLISTIRAGIQNELGENEEILKKFNLEY